MLSSLPSTRPQRPSARRAAARQSAATRAETTPKRPARTPTAKPRATPKRPAQTSPRTAKPQLKRSKPAEPPVPRQGFESEDAIQMGRPVQPPSGGELAASVVDLVGELAQTGISAGGRALRDAFTRITGG